MLRGIFRILSVVSIAVALVAGVLDVTRSVADSEMVFTPFYSDWLRFAPNSLARVQEFIVGSLGESTWDPIVLTLLKAPTWAVFTLLSILFGLLARRRKQRWQEKFGA